MKRFLSLSLAALGLVGCMGLAGCEEEGGGKTGLNEITAKEWKARFSTDFEALENFTAKMTMGSTYEKRWAEEYGEWEYFEDTLKFDKKSNVFYSQTKVEEYVPEEEKTVDGKEVTIEAHYEEELVETYYFSSGGKYYCVTNGNEGYKEAREAYEKYVEDRGYKPSFKPSFADYCEEWDVELQYQYPWLATELSKANYTHKTETMMNSMGMLEVLNTLALYEDMYSLFEYDKGTGRYKMMSMGTMTYEFGFPKNGGIEIYMQTTSISYVSQGVTDIGKTEITLLPQVVKAINYMEK